MRAGRLLLALFSAVVLGACNDSTGFGRVDIVEDTVLLAAPSSAAADSLPSALDVTVVAGLTIGGGRFPERVGDVENWDVALRLRGGQLQFVPPRALGFERGVQARAAITRPMTGRTFAEVRQVPASSSFLADSAVQVVQGAVYVVRSRQPSCFAPYYAKIQPLEVNAARGTVRVAVATATPCGDQRLVEED